MTRKRSIFAVLLLAILAVVALVGCEKDTFFKLTLDDGVSIVTEGIKPEKVAKDHEITVLVTVPEGKELESFKVNDEDKLAALQNFKYTFKVVKDTKINVTFKDKAVVEETFKLTLPAEVTVKSPEGLDLTKVKKGTEVVLKVTPPTGKEVDVFKVDGVAKTLTENLEFTVTVNSDMVVEVTFKDKEVPVVEYTLELSEGISVKSPEGLDLTKVQEGTGVTLLVSVPEGKKVKEFKVNDAVVQLDENLEHTLTITANTSVSVEFEDEFYTLTLSNGITQRTPEPGDEWEAIEDLTKIPYGTKVRLQIALPEGEPPLKSLMVTNGDEVSDYVYFVTDTLTFDLYVHGDVSFEASFLEGIEPGTKYKVTWNDVEGMRIRTEANRTVLESGVEVEAGTRLRFRSQPNEGLYVTKIIINEGKEHESVIENADYYMYSGKFTLFKEEMEVFEDGIFFPILHPDTTIKFVYEDKTALLEELYMEYENVVDGAPSYMWHWRWEHETWGEQKAALIEKVNAFLATKNPNFRFRTWYNAGGSGDGQQFVYTVEYPYLVGQIGNVQFLNTDPDKYTQYKVLLDLNGATYDGQTGEIEILFDAVDGKIIVTEETLLAKLPGIQYPAEHNLRRLLNASGPAEGQPFVTYQGEVQYNVHLKLFFEKIGEEIWDVTFQKPASWGGIEIISTIPVKNGNKVVPPEVQAPENYGVDYWYEVDENVPFDLETPITGNLTLNLKYKITSPVWKIVAEEIDGQSPYVIQSWSDNKPFQNIELFPGQKLPNIKFNQNTNVPVFFKGKSVLGLEMQLPGTEQWIPYESNKVVPNDFTEDQILKVRAITLTHAEGFNIAYDDVNDTYVISHVYKLDDNSEIIIPGEFELSEGVTIHVTKVTNQNQDFREDGDNNQEISKVQFPEGIVEFNQYLKNGLGKIAHLVLPSTVKIFNGRLASYGVKKVSFNNQSAISYLPNNMFQNSNITEIELPENLLEIPKYFLYRVNLTSLVVPPSVLSIADDAISSDTLTSLTLQEGLLSIGNRAIVAPNIETLEIPSSATEIGVFFMEPYVDGKPTPPKFVVNSMAENSGFYVANGHLLYVDTSILTGAELTFPTNVTSINLKSRGIIDGLHDNQTITKYTIPGHVKSVIYLPATAKLATIDIEDGVEYINDLANNASSLVSVTDASAFATELRVSPKFLFDSKYAKDQMAANEGLFIYNGTLVQMDKSFLTKEEINLPEGIKYLHGFEIPGDYINAQPYEYKVKKLILPETLKEVNTQLKGYSGNIGSFDMNEVVFKGDQITVLDRSFTFKNDPTLSPKIVFEKYTKAQIQAKINVNYAEDLTGFSPYFHRVDKVFNFAEIHGSDGIMKVVVPFEPTAEVDLLDVTGGYALELGTEYEFKVIVPEGKEVEAVQSPTIQKALGHVRPHNIDFVVVDGVVTFKMIHAFTSYEFVIVYK